MGFVAKLCVILVVLSLQVEGKSDGSAYTREGEASHVGLVVYFVD